MQSDLQSLSGVQLMEPRHLYLVPAEGHVWAPLAFLNEHLHLLTEGEQRILNAMRHRFEAGIHETLSVPMIRSSQLLAESAYRRVMRSGARSAYDPVSCIEFKGCRPCQQASFPSWEIGKDFTLKVKTIPFGIMTVENVMREFLGWAFLITHSLAAPHKPMAVFDYGDGMFCLAFHVSSPVRAESLLEGESLTTHDLLRLSERGMPLPEHELNLRGIPFDQYVAQKADYLLELQFHGGFRGILNSNIGNDVIAGGRFAGVCDLDTFHLMPVPTKRSSIVEVGDFVKRTVLETIKTSPPVLTWAGAPASGTMQQTLASTYQQKSCFFNTFHEGFLRRCEQRELNISMVNSAIQDAFDLSLAGELLMELIPNSFTFASFSGDSLYTPHH